MCTRSVKVRCIDIPLMNTADGGTGTDDKNLLLTPKLPQTRKSTECWLITYPSDSITVAKLSDCRQVVKYITYLWNDPENSHARTQNEDIAYSVIDSISIFGIRQGLERNRGRRTACLTWWNYGTRGKAWRRIRGEHQAPVIDEQTLWGIWTLSSILVQQTPLQK